MKKELFITIVLVSGEVLCGAVEPNTNYRKAAQTIVENCGYKWQLVKTFKETNYYGNKSL